MYVLISIFAEAQSDISRSFVRNSKLFKLRYTYIDICKDATGTLRCLELGGGIGQNSAFIHTCKSLLLVSG
jgi:hypothetical protein